MGYYGLNGQLQNGGIFYGEWCWGNIYDLQHFHRDDRTVEITQYSTLCLLFMSLSNKFDLYVHDLCIAMWAALFRRVALADVTLGNVDGTKELKENSLTEPRKF